MSNDFDWTKGGNEQACISNSLEVQAYAKKFPEKTLVIPRTRNRRTMVWNAHLQAKRCVEPLCRNDDASSPRKWTSYSSSNTRVRPRIFEKAEEEEHCRSTTTVIRQWQSCCFAQSFPSASSVSTEQYRIGAKNLLSRSQIIRLPARADPFRRWMTNRILESHPTFVSIWTNPLSINVPVQGDLLRSHSKRFETLPEDIRVSKASEDAGFMIKQFSWT